MFTHPADLLEKTSASIEVQPSVISTRDLLGAYLSGKRAQTLRAYSGDLADFSRFLRVATVEAAAAHLLSQGHAQANLMALNFRSDLESRGLAPATVGRRLAALRSLTKLARILGMVGWTLEVAAPKVIRYRDTRGPGLGGYRRLLEAARAQRNRAKAARDVAMLRLMGDRGLRRTEVAALDLEDLDCEGERIAVSGKGDGGEKEWLTVAPETMGAIAAWLDQRAGLGLPASGPVFTSFDHRHRDAGRRITGSGIYSLLQRLGKQADVAQRNPHGLRHVSITGILDVTGGDLRTAQKFARHSSPQTTILYDDARKDVAGAAARLLAAKVG